MSTSATTQLFRDKVMPESDYLKTKRDYERLAQQRDIEIESQKYQEENAKMQITQLEGTLAKRRRTWPCGGKPWITWS